MSTSNLIADLPRGGPLDTYRSRASFDWKQLKLFVYGENAEDKIKFEVINVLSAVIRVKYE